MPTLDRRDLVPLFILFIVTGAVFGVPLYHLIIDHHGIDFNAHLAFARDLQNGQLYVIHILFHILVVGLQALPLLDYELATWVIAIGFSGLASATLYLWLRPVTPSRLVALIVALLLIIVTPVTILTWGKPNLFIGYVSINLIHSPTMFLLRWFALLGFLYALRALSGKLAFNGRNVALGAVLIGLSVFSKPNFALVLLPALVIVLAYRYFRSRETTGLRLTVFGLIVPMLILLALQFVLQYMLIPNPTGSRIVFQPFAILLFAEPSVPLLIVKYLMSMLFPLVFTLLYRKTALNELSIVLGWLMFAAGIAQVTLFAETGTRFQDANFLWSAQIGLFLLFVAAARLWLRDFKREPRAYITGIALTLHVVSGIVMLVALSFVEREFVVW